MDYNKNKNTLVQDILLEEIPMVDIIDLWNNMCNDEGLDTIIYPMSDFNIVLRNNTPSEIAMYVSQCENEFSLKKIYFSFYGGRLMCFNTLDEFDYFSFVDLADYLIKSKWDKLKYYEKEFMEEIVSLCSDKNGCAANVLEDIKAFGFVNVITDDWNDLIGLINKLIGK